MESQRLNYASSQVSKRRTSTRFTVGYGAKLISEFCLSAFGGRAARSPTFYEVKHSGLYLCYTYAILMLSAQTKVRHTHHFFMPPVPAFRCQSLAERTQFPLETGKCALTMCADCGSYFFTLSCDQIALIVARALFAWA